MLPSRIVVWLLEIDCSGHTPNQSRKHSSSHFGPFAHTCDPRKPLDATKSNVGYSHLLERDCPFDRPSQLTLLRHSGIPCRYWGFDGFMQRDNYVPHYFKFPSWIACVSFFYHILRILVIAGNVFTKMAVTFEKTTQVMTTLYRRQRNILS